jgi:hypothetical protein
VRDTAPTPRRRRPADKVAPPPISEAELPLWLIEPKKCIAPVDLDDPTKGLCGKPVNRVGNQTLTCSTDCGEKLETVGWRRRGQKYYWTHREEILAKDRGTPLPCQAPVDVDDLDKGLCGKPSRNRPRPYKTCSPACSKKLKVFTTRQVGKRFREKHAKTLECKYCGGNFQHFKRGGRPMACPKPKCQEAHNQSQRADNAARALRAYHAAHPGAPTRRPGSAAPNKERLPFARDWKAPRFLSLIF